jgi:uncharacterized membrane protein
MINKKSSIGNIDSNILLIGMNVLSLTLYLLPVVRYFAWGIPLLIYLLENKNGFIRKQAAQAMMLFIIGSLFSAIIYLLRMILVPVTYIQYVDINLVGVNSFLLGLVNIFSLIVMVTIFTFSIIDMIRVYNYYDYSIPILGEYIVLFRSLLDKIVGKVDENNFDKDIMNDCEKGSDIVVGELIKNIEYREKPGVRNSKKKKDNVINKDGIYNE